MTRKQQEREAKRHFEAWKQSKDYSLEFAYGSFSAKKERAWSYCEEKQLELRGTGLKVITYNRMKFTAGFEYSDEKTGVCMFYYISPSFDCAVEVTADML